MRDRAWWAQWAPLMGLAGAGLLFAGAVACGAGLPAPRAQQCQAACARIHPALAGSAPAGRTPQGQQLCLCWYTEVDTILLPRGT